MYAYITNFIVKNVLNGISEQEILIYNDKGTTLKCTRLVLNSSIRLEEYIYQRENLQNNLDFNVKLNSLNYVYILTEKPLTNEERTDIINYMEINESMIKDRILQNLEFCSYSEYNTIDTLNDIGTCFLYLNEFTIETVNINRQLVYYEFSLLNDNDASKIYKHTRRIIKIIDCEKPNSVATSIVSKVNGVMCVAKTRPEIKEMVQASWLLLPREFQKITQYYARYITPENLVINMASWLNMIDRNFELNYVLSYKIDRTDAINMSNILKMESLSENTIKSLDKYKTVANREYINTNSYEIETKYYYIFIGQTNNINIIEIINSCV